MDGADNELSFLAGDIIVVSKQIKQPTIDDITLHLQIMMLIVVVRLVILAHASVGFREPS